MITAEIEPFTIDRSTSDDPLDCFDIGELEGIVKEHLPPAVRKIACKWVELSEASFLETFVETLEPHLRDQVPGFRALVAHVLADMDSVEGICAAVRGEPRNPAP